MLAPSTSNLMIGKGRMYFKKEGSTGFKDLGNVPSFTLKPELTKLDHYSSREGTKKKDKSIITEAKFTSSFTMEDINIDNLELSFLGDGVTESTQASSYSSGTAVTVSLDEFVSLGKVNLSIVKITFGTVTGGSFAVGNSVTGGTSSATGKIGWTATGLMELYNVSGTFVAGETITCSAVSTTALSAEVKNDIIVTDAASPTTRYVQSEDYDVDVRGGLLRALTDGDITTTAYVSYDIAATTLSTIAPLTNTSCEGELLFIGDPDEGGKFRGEFYSCQLTANSEIGFISDNFAIIQISVEILADTVNHPSEPYGKIVELS